MEELLSLGVLRDEEYTRLLRRVVDTRNATSSACELVKRAVEARETAHPGAATNPLLTVLYWDILNHWLVPPLLKILRHSTEVAKGCVVPLKTHVTQSSECVGAIHSAVQAEGEMQESNPPEEPALQKASEEVNLVTKLCDLAAVMCRILSDAPRVPHSAPECEALDGSVGSGLQQTCEPIKKVFEAIATGLCVESRDGVDEEKRHRVKLLSLAFGSLVRSGWYTLMCGLQLAARQVVEAALSTVEVWQDPGLTVSLFALVIHPYAETSQKDESKVFQKLWDIVYSFYSVGEDGEVVERSTVGLVVVCCLSDLLPDGAIFRWTGEDKRFWLVLQHGLAHSDAPSRKRARHVLRRCVDQCPSERASPDYLPWSEGQRECVMALWDDLFLLLETLEEKQTHVVRPVLEKLDRLIRSCQEEVMHPRWVVAVLRRVLAQDNRTVKLWGVSKVLGLRLPQRALSQGFLAFVTHHLLPTLADYSLYGREPGQQAGEPSRVGSQIPGFLSAVLDALEASQQQRFLSTLLEQLFRGQVWGGVPLLYLVRGLALLPPTPAWTFLQVREAAVSLEGCLSTQEVGLRSASQCDFLRAVLSHSSNTTTFLELCHLLTHLRRQESWRRGTASWRAVLEGVAGRWEGREERLRALRLSIAEQLSGSLQQDVQPREAGLALCLLLEEDGEGVGEVLAPLTVFLQDCHMRPYLDQSGRVWAVQLLTHTLEILSDGAPGDPECPSTLAVLAEGLECLLQGFVMQLGAYSQPQHLQDLLLYLALLQHCRGQGWCKAVAWRHYPEVLEGCQSLLEQQEQQPVPACLGVVVLEHLLEHYFPAALPHHQDTAARLLALHLGALTHSRHLPGHQPSPATTRLLLVTSSSCWHCAELLLQAKGVWWQGKEAEKVETAVLEVLPGAVATAGRCTIIHVFQVAKVMAPTLIKAGMWEEVMEAMWNISFEFRKGCDLYRTLIGCLTDLLFHRDAMACPDCHGCIIKVSQEMLKTGEGVQGLATHMSWSLASSIAEAGTGQLGWFKLLVKQVLAPLLMFGGVFRKQQRVVRDALLFVGSCGDHYTCCTQREGILDSDSRARATALRYLLSLRAERAEDRVAAAAVVEGIIHQYGQTSALRRDFPNSQSHRYKTRLLQAFLVLVPLLNKDECENCLSWLSEGLTCDHQQPSVRYLQEWGVALLTILHPSLHPTLLLHFHKSVEVRVGCVGSFLAALTHASCTSSDPTVLSTALKHCLAWCSAQHFNTRLYAQRSDKHEGSYWTAGMLRERDVECSAPYIQVSLRKIWQHCEEQWVEAVLQEFRAVPLCLAQHGNAARNTLNMLNDFYFKVFHPVHHYTLQTIFHDLPRLSLLADDEWMSVEYLVDVAGKKLLPIHSSLPLHNPDSALVTSTPAPWVVKAAGEEQQADEEVTSEVRNVQKKIIPKKVLVSEGTSLPHQQQAGWKGGHGDLIVVATLVDKAANLGGLCRTCEAFGVRELVVSSRAVLQDHTFTSLALTAHCWLPITEVRREDLLPYLKARQAEGYMLVGAEQTAQSTSLEEFTFPERTVLVLGNERTGVSCEVLQVLEASVQIPQSGTVRSLNVHVSGALFIWEYTRQALAQLPIGGGGGGGGWR